MGEERETEWEKWAKCHECFLISCLSSCFHVSKRPACGELVNFAALVVHSHPLCVAVARPPHISLTYISTATVAPLIFARRAPSRTESGHCCWWRKSTSFIHCQKNHHPCGDDLLSPGSLTVHLEFTPGDSGDERIFFFFFSSCWGIWNERAKGDYNTCAFARAIHPSLFWSLHGDGGFFARTLLFIFKLPW